VHKYGKIRISGGLLCSGHDNGGDATIWNERTREFKQSPRWSSTMVHCSGCFVVWMMGWLLVRIVGFSTTKLSCHFCFHSKRGHFIIENYSINWSALRE
jgi:hypothetical protein